MLEMNKAERTIWKQAQTVVRAARGNEEFEELKVAVAKFDAYVEMAIDLEQTTDERVEAIKKMAKNKVYSK